MKRRTIPKLDSIDAVMRHLSTLQQSGYHPLGHWSLGQVCNHLAESIDLMSGRMMRFVPRIAQRLFIGAFLRLAFLGKLGNPLGLRIPTALPQKHPVEDHVGVERLRDAFKRAKQSTPHLMEFHLWHCRHHFSFLAVDSSETAGAKPHPNATASVA